jgi:hypothetical protein
VFPLHTAPTKKTSSCEHKKRPIKVISFSSYLPSFMLAGIGTVFPFDGNPLPRLQRASPSTSLDKKTFSFFVIKNSLPGQEENVNSKIENLLFLSSRSCLGTWWNWHSVFSKNEKPAAEVSKGHVPPPLWIRNTSYLLDVLYHIPGISICQMFFRAIRLVSAWNC